ncbi:hypothetical protein [Dactylosporangium cerinum]
MKPDSRLPALTGLRWAAALVVFGQHTLELFYDPDLVAPRPVRAALWTLLVNGGARGVSFFFVLSGFVLTWSTPPGEGPPGSGGGASPGSTRRRSSPPSSRCSSSGPVRAGSPRT